MRRDRIPHGTRIHASASRATQTVACPLFLPERQHFTAENAESAEKFFLSEPLGHPPEYPDCGPEDGPEASVLPHGLCCAPPIFPSAASALSAVNPSCAQTPQDFGGLLNSDDMLRRKTLHIRKVRGRVSRKEFYRRRKWGQCCYLCRMEGAYRNRQIMIRHSRQRLAPRDNDSLLTERHFLSPV